jgi:hypothetical protein
MIPGGHGDASWVMGPSFVREVADRLEESFDERYTGWIEFDQRRRREHRKPREERLTFGDEAMSQGE